MQIIISIFIIQQLLYLTPRVDSLKGQHVKKVGDNDLSFVAALRYFPTGETFCAGVLITNKHVITMSNCLEDETPAEIRVAFRSVNTIEDVVAITSYSVNSWQSYYNWAVGRGSHHNETDANGIAIITLNQIVQNVTPARLSQLSKHEIQGKKGIITGWNDGLSRSGLRVSSVNFLTDEDCQNKVSKITNQLWEIGARAVCSSAMPHAFLEDGDSGAPIININKEILGLSYGCSPDLKYAFKKFTNKFLQHYKVNIHFSIDYYRQFIVDTTGYL